MLHHYSSFYAPTCHQYHNHHHPSNHTNHTTPSPDQWPFHLQGHHPKLCAIMLLTSALISVAMILILLRICIWPFETKEAWESELPIGSHGRRPTHQQSGLRSVYGWREYGAIDNDSEKEHDFHTEMLAAEIPDQVMQGDVVLQEVQVHVWTRAGYPIDPEDCLLAWIVDHVRAFAAARRNGRGEVGGLSG